MADNIKRLFSRGRQRDSQGRESRDNDSETQLSFGEIRYEDVPSGAAPAQGLLPIRGNRLFAVRQVSGNDAQPIPPALESQHSRESFPPRVNRFPSSWSRRTSRQSSAERDVHGAAAEDATVAQSPGRRSTSSRLSAIIPRSQRTSRRNSVQQRDVEAVPLSNASHIPTDTPGKRYSATQYTGEPAVTPPRHSRQGSTQQKAVNYATSQDAAGQGRLAADGVSGTSPPTVTGSTLRNDEARSSRSQSPESAGFLRQDSVRQLNGADSHSNLPNRPHRVNQSPSVQNGILQNRKIRRKKLSQSNIDGVIDGLDWLNHNSDASHDDRQKHQDGSSVLRQTGVVQKQGKHDRTSGARVAFSHEFTPESPVSALSGISWTTAEEGVQRAQTGESSRPTQGAVNGVVHQSSALISFPRAPNGHISADQSDRVDSITDKGKDGEKEEEKGQEEEQTGEEEEEAIGEGEEEEEDDNDESTYSHDFRSIDEVVQGSQYNSVDTTVHKSVAPGKQTHFLLDANHSDGYQPSHTKP